MGYVDGLDQNISMTKSVRITMKEMTSIWNLLSLDLQ